MAELTEKENSVEEYEMNNGQTDINDFLTVRGFGGYGYGGGGYGGSGGGTGYAGQNVLASLAHADGTANNANTISNNQRIGTEADCTRTILTAGIDNMQNSFENVTRDNQFAATLNAISDQEFRNGDRLRDVERLMVQNAKEAAECCCDAKLEAQKVACDTQKLVIEENSRTRELINARALSEAERELDRSDRNGNTTTILAAMNNQTNALVSAINSINGNGHR